MQVGFGKRARSKWLPDCEHRKPVIDTDNFEIKWIESLGLHLHLHCPECEVTAKNAIRKKIAERIKGYDVMPEGYWVCEWCSQWFDPETSESDRVCSYCDADVFPCEQCNTLKEIVTDTCDHCGYTAE